MLRKIACPFKIKSAADDGTFSGYGSVFDVVDFHDDIVKPGAFKASLASHRAAGTMPAMLWQHNADEPIGVYTDITEDNHGLLVKGRLLVDDVARAGEAHALLKAGAISGLSIGFRIKRDEYDRDNDIRIIHEADLWETSLVTFPANDMARVSIVKSITTRRAFEKFLRESGFSKKEAIRIASRGFDRRDSGQGETDAELTAALKKYTQKLQEATNA